MQRHADPTDDSAQVLARLHPTDKGQDQDLGRPGTQRNADQPLRLPPRSTSLDIPKHAPLRTGSSGIRSVIGIMLGG
jgi:hypothetical protein